MRTAIVVTALMLSASLPAIGQAAELSSSRSKVIALENAWNQAEERKDARALDEILDSSLIYTDDDGTLVNKADFLAGVKGRARHGERQVAESMNAQVYDDGVVVTGVYHGKGMVKGKPFPRGRFTDTWVRRNGKWVCVASQYTLISK